MTLKDATLLTKTIKSKRPGRSIKVVLLQQEHDPANPWLQWLQCLTVALNCLIFLLRPLIWQPALPPQTCVQKHFTFFADEAEPLSLDFQAVLSYLVVFFRNSNLQSCLFQSPRLQTNVNYRRRHTKLADVQCSSITKGNIYHSKHNVHTTFTTVVD